MSNRNQDQQPPFYRILGVSQDASTEEIRAAYQQLVKENHPDVSSDPDSELIAGAQTAREILTDEDRRGRYDRMGHEKFVRLEMSGTLPDVFDPVENGGTGSDSDTESTPPPPPGPRSNRSDSDQSREAGRGSGHGTVGDKGATTRVSAEPTSSTPDDQQTGSIDDQERSGTEGVYSDQETLQQNAGATVQDRFEQSAYIRGFAAIVVFTLSIAGFSVGGYQPPGGVFTAIALSAVVTTVITVVTGYRAMQRLYLGSDEYDTLAGSRRPFGIGLLGLALVLLGLGILGDGVHPLAFPRQRLLFGTGVSPWEWLVTSQQGSTVIHHSVAISLIGSTVLGMVSVVYSISRRAWHSRFIKGESVNIILWDVTAWGLLVLWLGGVAGSQDLPGLPTVGGPIFTAGPLAPVDVSVLAMVGAFVLWSVQSVLLEV